MSRHNFKKGDRIITELEINSGISSLAKGTIGTIEDFLNDEIAIIRHSLDNEENNLIAGVPISSIRLVDASELLQIDSNHVLNKNFRVGSIWRTTPQYKLLPDKDVFEIKAIYLALNQEDDNYQLNPLGEEVSEKRTFLLKRKSVEDCFVQYNKELEEQLGEEITQTGELYDLRPGMRIKTKERVGIPLELFRLVAVIIDIDENEENVKIGFYHNNEIRYINTKITNIRPATEEEISNSAIKNLIDSKYHAGNNFRANDMVQYVFQLNELVQPGDIIQITDVEKIAPYVLEDKFAVAKLDNSTFSLLTYDLHSYFEHIISEETKEERSLEEIEFENEIHNYIEEQEQIQEEELEKVFIKKIEIRGIDFDLEEKYFIGPSQIKYEDIDNYIKALSTLKKFHTV